MLPSVTRTRHVRYVRYTLSCTRSVANRHGFLIKNSISHSPARRGPCTCGGEAQRQSSTAARALRALETDTVAAHAQGWQRHSAGGPSAAEGDNLMHLATCHDRGTSSNPQKLKDKGALKRASTASCLKADFGRNQPVCQLWRLNVTLVKVAGEAMEVSDPSVATQQLQVRTIAVPAIAPGPGTLALER